MPKCPKCTAGRITVTVNNGVDEPAQLEMDCPYCDGKGEVSDKKLAAIEAVSKIWCLCGNPSQQCTYHPDEPGLKHHWTCDDCGKVTQIG